MGIGFVLFLFGVLRFFFFLFAGHRVLSPELAGNHIELFAHPFQFVGGFRSFGDVVANAQLQLERCRQAVIARVNIGVLRDGQGLGEALPVHGEANGIFPGQSHRPDLGFANSPMQNLPRIAPAETALLPNVRILRRSRAQRDELRRIAEKRSEEHTSELQSRLHLVCRLLLEKKKKYDRHDSIQTSNALNTSPASVPIIAKPRMWSSRPRTSTLIKPGTAQLLSTRSTAYIGSS